MTPGPWMVEQGRAARVRHPGPGGPHLPPPLWLCPVSSLPLSRTVCKHRRSPGWSPRPSLLFVGSINSQRAFPSRSASHAHEPRGEAQRVIWLQQARRPVPCSRDWRPGLWCCSVAMATALRGGPSSQLPFIPGRGEERGCWNSSFSLFFFLCCDLDEQSLKCSLAIFFCLRWKTSGCSRAIQRKSCLLSRLPRSPPWGRQWCSGQGKWPALQWQVQLP